MNLREYLRPSSLPALELCPGRAMMEAWAVDICPELLRIVHQQAEQGTLGHAVIAQTLVMIYNGPEGWVNPASVTPKLEALLSGLRAWSADSARRCVAYVVAVVGQLEAQGFRVRVHVEMNLSGRKAKIARGGTADVVLECFDDTQLRHVVIIDHKLGFLNQGHAVDHLQLGGYAVMAWDKFSRPDQPIEFVDVHLAQGRLRDYSCGRYGSAGIEAARERIGRVIDAATGDAPELRPTIDACRYCKALVLCRAARRKFMDMAEETALFGVDQENRLALIDAVAIAKRFVEEVGLAQKEWVRTEQASEASAKEATNEAAE